MFIPQKYDFFWFVVDLPLCKIMEFVNWEFLKFPIFVESHKIHVPKHQKYDNFIGNLTHSHVTQAVWSPKTVDIEVQLWADDQTPGAAQCFEPMVIFLTCLWFFSGGRYADNSTTFACLCLHIYIPYIYYELYYNILYIYVCIFIYTLKYIYFMQQRMGMSQDWNTLFLKGRNNSWNVHVHDHLLEGIVHLGYMWKIQNIGKSWVSMNISGIYLPQIVSMSILAKQSVSWSCE